MGHVTSYPLIFTIRTHKYKQSLVYLLSSIWYYHIKTNFFPSPWVACHCDDVLIYPRATAESLISFCHIETHFFPSPQVAYHCDHVTHEQLVWLSFLCSTFARLGWVSYLSQFYGFRCQPLEDPHSSSFRVACFSSPL